MSMKFFAIPNLSSHDVEVVDPATSELWAPLHESKEARRAWQSAITTKHLFYSACEGLTPSLRVTERNKPYKLHGLVCDYDSKISDAELGSLAKNAAQGLLPTWISHTFSGGARLVFEFENPVYVDNPDLADRFLKELKRELKLKYLLPGLDEKSLNLTQYFELGRDWRRVTDAEPISSKLLELLFYRAAEKKVIRGEGPNIPIEAVAAEVEKRWPGRINGEFTVGLRTPLFWIDDGIDRIGAQVGDFGMICYSDRAHKSFIHWGEILGHEFVRNYQAERIGAAADGLWFDGRHYWRKGENGHWRYRNKEDAIMWLKGQGISARINSKETISEAERVLLAVQEARSVDMAIPFVLDSRELVVECGYRYLNVATKKAMPPSKTGVPADFPWLHNFFETILDDEQRDYFYAWFKRFWLSGYNRQLDAGHALFIAGNADQGKTFLNQFILGRAIGGFADASRYLLGESHFNKECGENALWCVDDAHGTQTAAKRREFAEAIKKHIANPHAPKEAKFKDSVTLPWRGRIVVTTNTDPDSLSIIPPLDATIKDKVILFKFLETAPAISLPRHVLEPKVLAELPAFLAWLRDWSVPEYVIEGASPRYGINAYHHPEILDAANEVSPHHGFAEALDEWVNEFRIYNPELPDTREMSGTALLCEMQKVEGLRGVLRYYHDGNIGRTLRALMRQPKSRITKYHRGHGSGRRYTIDMRP
jgi:hypothetical protein